MRKFHASFTLIFYMLMNLPFSYCAGQDQNVADKVLKDTCFILRDGSYEGKSRAIYTGEPYWGIARITIKNDSVTEMNFIIRDSSLHETFNANYEKHFLGIDEYILQSRNDWRGVQLYSEKFNETKDTGKIDAISGATWSYNIFKASVKEALKKAKRQIDTLTSRSGLNN
jgi:major membrane immunogen (membrane-anchored lipoprotein)